MKFTSFETLIKALDAAGVRYLVAGRTQDKLDIHELRMLYPDDARR